MSYFYGFNKDEATCSSPGIYMGPALFTGNGNTTLYNYPVNFSNPSYVGQTIVGRTGRIVLCYRNGTSFRGDIQLTTIQYNSPKVRLIDFSIPLSIC